MPSLKPEWDKLKSSSSYREFLRFYLEEKSLSFSDLARAVGCHRGFPKDIISGKRRLTSKSYYDFEKALRIPAEGRKMFRYLVAYEEKDVLPELDRRKLPTLITSLKCKSWSRSRRDITKIENTGIQNILSDPNVSLVFAATGDCQRGASFTEIKQRTRLDDKVLENTLNGLISSRLLKLDSGRYFSSDLHIFIQDLDQKKILSNLFRHASLSASLRASEKWNSDSEFFFLSNICVRKSQMPELKKALKETVLAFVDNSIDEEGDCIVKVMTSFHL
ncbi:MAG: hypothetical protein ACXVCY_09920 [Pseudobdellovibrionaceae bacterium]